ncbi:MAG: DNA primase [Calditerrivibrio sp.]|nr:DNA primase [Calditerrivibrio sp.]
MEKVKDIILDRLDILDYISQYVELKRAGKYYKGLCPFHSEKTPSFTVTPEKGLFHCFGCGASGNLITFVMKYNNLSFIDALKYLAERAGVSMDRDDKADKFAQNLKKFHKDLKNFSKDLFQKVQNIKDYIYKRGFSEKELELFDVGFVPEGYDINQFLKGYGFDIIKSSGLFYYRDGSNYFKLSGRLLFPIKDIYGDVIAFSGRDLVGGQPKYINSPETSIFKKGMTLYNLNIAKEHIREERIVYVVEGYFDVIRMWHNGYKNVVSSMGTAFTKEQALLLKRYADGFIIIFDGDQAGINAAYKTLDPFIEINSIPEVVFLENGEDPDSLLLKHAEDFVKVLGNKRDLLMLLAERYAQNSGSLSQKLKIFESLMKKIEKFPESITKSFYQKEIGKIFNLDISIKGKEGKKSNKIANSNKKVDLKYICEDDFLSALFMIKDEETISRLVDGLDIELFMNQKNRIIFSKIIDIIKNYGSIDTLFNDIEIGEYIAGMVVGKEFEQPYKTAILNRNKMLYNKSVNEYRQLQAELKTTKVDKDRLSYILERINKLTSEMSKYNILEA